MLPWLFPDVPVFWRWLVPKARILRHFPAACEGCSGRVFRQPYPMKEHGYVEACYKEEIISNVEKMAGRSAREESEWETIQFPWA